MLGIKLELFLDTCCTNLNVHVQRSRKAHEFRGSRLTTFGPLIQEEEILDVNTIYFHPKCVNIYSLFNIYRLSEIGLIEKKIVYIFKIKIKRCPVYHEKQNKQTKAGKILHDKRTEQRNSSIVDIVIDIPNRQFTQMGSTLGHQML